MASRINVAVDGPSGVGKSSVCDLIAERFDMTHLDTGAMYRAIGYTLDSMHVAPEEGEKLDQALEAIELKVNGDQVYVNGKNVSSLIRTPEVSRLASAYATLPSVRKKLVAEQQQIAKEGGYILDGRDICSIVLPDAQVRVFLDASSEARAMRRYLQDQEKGLPVVYEEVLKQIEERDFQDRHRAVSPLLAADGAIILDSSNLNLEQTADALGALVEEALLKQN